MSDPQYEPPKRFGDGWMDPTRNNIILIYILYLVSFLVVVASVIGLISAYMNRGKAEAWLQTHYTWAIRTFWIALAMAVVSTILTLLLIGFIGFIVTGVWVIARVLVGLQKVTRNEPISNPQSWLI